MATAADDHTVRVWDRETGEQIGAPLPNGDCDVAWLDDTTLLVDDEGDASLWNFDTSTWSDIAWRVAGRTMTRDEWGNSGLEPSSIGRRASSTPSIRDSGRRMADGRPRFGPRSRARSDDLPPNAVAGHRSTTSARARFERLGDRECPRLPTTNTMSRPIAILTAVVAVCSLNACGDDSPERPGAPLEIDGESPTITDPGGVANDVTDLTED